MLSLETIRNKIKHGSQAVSDALKEQNHDFLVFDFRILSE